MCGDLDAGESTGLPGKEGPTDSTQSVWSDGAMNDERRPDVEDLTPAEGARSSSVLPPRIASKLEKLQKWHELTEALKPEEEKKDE